MLRSLKMALIAKISLLFALNSSPIMRIFTPSRFYTVLFLLLFPLAQAFGQGGTCSSIEPFCAGNQALIFANCNNQDPDCVATAEVGPDYGCL